MSETKFTPGPWFADGIFVCDNDDSNVCVCEQDNWEPDSYLIAAAPELYDALEMCVKHLDADGNLWSKEDQAMAIAALAKARGEE